MAQLDFSLAGDSLQAIFERYGPAPFRIDLGCGQSKPKGYIGLDNCSGFPAQIPNPENLPDIYMDLNYARFPFHDNSCEVVRCSHFLEHSNVDHIVMESYRVLVEGGTLLIIVPYANSAEGMYPGHSLFFTEKWFHLNIVFQKHFEILEEHFKESDEFAKFPPELKRLLPFEVARTFLFNACNEMTLVCRPRK